MNSYVVSGKTSGTMQLFIFLLVLLPFIGGRKHHDIPGVEKLHCNYEIRYEGHSISILHGNIFSHCKKVRSLYLSNNNIQVIEDNAFKNLTNLNQLDLYLNVITTLPTGIFSDIQNIEYINLSINRLTSLQTNLFANLQYLRSVNLQFNNITHIQENCFVNVPNLVRINLAYNNLKTLQFNIIDDISSLEAIYLVGNPWNCDPDLCEFMYTVVTRFWQEPNVPICFSPNGTRGVTWKEVLETPVPAIVSNVRDNPTTDHVVMHCHTCSKTYLSWQFEKFKNLTNQAIQMSGKYLTSSTLTINDFSSIDEGNYTCYIGNCSTCEATSAWIYVHTKRSTTFTTSNVHIIIWPVGTILVILSICYRFYKYRISGQNQSASGFSPLGNN